MNAENALAAIRDIEKPTDKGKKEDNHRGQNRECPDRRTNDGAKRKDEKNSSNSKIHSFSYASWQNFGPD